MIDLKNELSNNKINESEFADRKRRNNVNKFLNSYFRFIAVFILVVFLWVAIRFMIKPRFEDAITLSNNALKQKKTEFLSEYKKMENYKRLLPNFRKLILLKLAK